MTVPQSVIRVSYRLFVNTSQQHGRVYERLSQMPETLKYQDHPSSQEPISEWVIACQRPADGDLLALEARLLEAIRGEP